MNIKSKLQALEEVYLEVEEAKITYNENEDELTAKLNSIVRRTNGLSFYFEDGDFCITIHSETSRQSAYKALDELYKPEIKEALDENRDLYIRYLSLLNEYYNQQYEISDYLKDNREKYGIPENVDIKVIHAEVYFYSFSTEVDEELKDKFYQLVENSNEY